MTDTLFDPRRGWTSASDALYDSLCKGRHLAQAGISEPEPSEDAQSGVLIHAALAGQVLAGELTGSEREMITACQEIEQKICVDYFGERPPLPVRSIREKPDGTSRLWVVFTKDGKSYQHSGQPDVIHRCGTRALICEYKTGANEVAESSSNMQLRDQAVLVYGNHTLLDEVATVVIQPLITREPEICTYDKESLQRASAEMYERVVLSNTAGQPRTAGESQCAHCRAKRTCVEYQKFAGALTPPAILSVLEVPMAQWTAEQLSTALSAVAPAQKFLDEIKAFAKEGLKANPDFAPGWTLRAGARIETITDPQRCFDRFAAEVGSGMSAEDKLSAFMRTVKVGKTRLRDELASATGQKGKRLDATLSEITQDIVAVTQNEPSLVRAKEAK